MLAQRAPGRRVLEVGSGLGLLSCVAAKLGAAHVYAVESTELAERTRWLVEENGLTDRVTVVRGTIEQAPIEQVDVAFSELLNADPFFEGVVSAMDAAARWLVPGGFLSPRRVKVYVALAWAEEPPDEFERASSEIRRICAEHGLRSEPLLRSLDVWHPHRFVTHAERPVSTAGLAFDHWLGRGEAPPERVEVAVQSHVDGRVGGALVWFSAEVDEDLWMTNPPGAGSHWGQMVCGWTRPLPVRVGQRVRLEVRRIGTEVLVSPLTG